MAHAASLKAENNRMAFSPPSPFSPSHSGGCSPHNGESRLSDITGLFLYQHKKEEKGVGGGDSIKAERGLRFFKQEMADDYIVAFRTEGTSELRLRNAFRSCLQNHGAIKEKTSVGISKHFRWKKNTAFG